MARAKGQKLRITEQQFDDYIELIQRNNGRLRNATILEIQQKYNLPEPHKRLTIMRRLRRKEEREGVSILAKRKGWSKIKRGENGSAPKLSFNEGIEIMLTAFERAKKYPELEARLRKCEQNYAQLKEMLRQQEMRFKLAQQREKSEELVT